MINDDDFIKYAEEQNELFSLRKKSNLTSNEDSKFELINWTGLEKEGMKIIRVYGGIPDKKTGDPNIDDYTARIVNVSWIVGDDGKKFRCIFPVENENNTPASLIRRIIERVNEVEWVNKVKVFINEKKHPEIYDMVMYNGYKKGDLKRRFDRGWKGQNVILMNVIDRAKMEWHKKNKHSLLLSKNVLNYENNNGEESQFADIGVPIYGFYTVIVSKLFKHYGNWNKYDIGIVRTGRMDLPYDIFNASAYKLGNLPELSEPYKQIVSTSSSFTEEEKSWQLYNLSKLFGYTTFKKIADHLSNKIQKIDSVFNTNYYDELMYGVEQEEKKLKENSEEGGDEKIIIKTEKVTDNITVTEITSNKVNDNDCLTKLEKAKPFLKGYNFLEEDHKKVIKDVIIKNGNVVDIVFDDVIFYDKTTNEGYKVLDSLERCPRCGIATPSFFRKGCIVCGLELN